MEYNQVKQLILQFPDVKINEEKRLLTHDTGNQEVPCHKTYDAPLIGKLIISFDIQGDATNWYCAGTTEQIEKADGIVITPDV